MVKDSDITEATLQAITAVTPSRRSANPQDRLLSIGVDSLALLAVITDVEQRLGVNLDDGEIATAIPSTVQDLIILIGNACSGHAQ